MEITHNIAKLGCSVLAIEPNIESLPKNLAAHNITLSSLEDALIKADVVCVLVKHSLFVSAVESIKQHGTAIDAVGILG